MSVNLVQADFAKVLAIDDKKSVVCNAEKLLKYFFGMDHGAGVDNKGQPCCMIVYEPGLAEVLLGLQPKQDLGSEQSSG